MNPVKDISAGCLQPLPAVKKGENLKGEGFQDTLKTMISQVNGQIREADQIAEDFAVGNHNNLHEVMIAAEKADLSFKFLLEIRNKLMEAYQEIMRMNF